MVAARNGAQTLIVLAIVLVAAFGIVPTVRLEAHLRKVFA